VYDPFQLAHNLKPPVKNTTRQNNDTISIVGSFRRTQNTIHTKGKERKGKERKHSKS
ncbi:MAG: hypothetical protein ACI90V_001511, partial [Bacillariaceae sp.]